MGCTQNEIQQLQHLSNRQGEWFDRLISVAVRRDWRLVKIRAVPLYFLDLIADSWHTPFPTYQGPCWICSAKWWTSQSGGSTASTILWKRPQRTECLC
jgi:hypothetical protein